MTEETTDQDQQPQPTPRKKVCDMGWNEAIGYLSTLVRQEIRYARNSEMKKPLEIFGEQATIQWHDTPMYALVVNLAGKPCIAIKGPIRLFGNDTMHVPISDLYDVVPVVEQESPQDVMIAVAARLEDLARYCTPLLSALMGGVNTGMSYQDIRKSLLSLAAQLRTAAGK